MKTIVAALCLALSVPAIAADVSTQNASAAAAPSIHRYLIERTFPPGALKGLDAATKQKVNANNASVGVRWVESFANADETKTYCVYEGPSEAAVRQAAELNKLPVDKITEVPVTLSPQ
jgi:predicted dinucleotide-utilizing enzyme